MQRKVSVRIGEGKIMGNYFIEQIGYGLSVITQKEKTPTIRAIIVTKPNGTDGAYLKIDWINTDAPPPQVYGTPIYPAGNIAEFTIDLNAAAAHFGVVPEDIATSTHMDDPVQQEAFSNRGHSQITGDDRNQLFEIHEPPDLIEGAQIRGWRRWAFKPVENI